MLLSCLFSYEDNSSSIHENVFSDVVEMNSLLENIFSSRVWPAAKTDRNYGKCRSTRKIGKKNHKTH